MDGVDLPEHAPASMGLARHVDPTIADLECLEGALVAQPVCDQLAEEACLEQAVEDHAREPDAPSEVRVVVDLVEGALRARVLHELARGRVLDALGDPFAASWP